MLDLLFCASATLLLRMHLPEHACQREGVSDVFAEYLDIGSTSQLWLIKPLSHNNNTAALLWLQLAEKLFFFGESRRLRNQFKLSTDEP
jgi:hypothetical protein